MTFTKFIKSEEMFEGSRNHFQLNKVVLIVQGCLCSLITFMVIIGRKGKVIVKITMKLLDKLKVGKGKMSTRLF